MKIYLLYLLPKNKLYAISDNKKIVKRFLSERNHKLFNMITKSISTDDALKMLSEYKLMKLNEIPLEDSDGDYSIIGTIEEDNLLSHVCERMFENCQQLKLHFTQNFPFKMEYKYLIDDLTNVTKNINNHPIIQIDSIRLFYYLFKETFVDIGYLDELDTTDDESDIIEKFKAYY